MRGVAGALGLVCASAASHTETLKVPTVIQRAQRILPPFEPASSLTRAGLALEPSDRGLDEQLEQPIQDLATGGRRSKPLRFIGEPPSVDRVGARRRDRIE